SGDLWVKSARYPQVAVGSSGDRTWSSKSGKLGDNPIRGHAAELVHCLLGEPHVPIRTSGNVAGKRIGRGRSEFSKPAGCDLETPHGMISLVRKPDVAIGSGGDADAHSEKGELILRDDSIRRDRS